MSSPPLRFGLIGTGMMGCEHLMNLNLVPDARVVALADPEPRSLGWARAALGPERAAAAAPYPDAESLLAHPGGLDAVIVASPNHTHAAVLERLLATDLHILCEKPLATDVADARRVAERAAARPRGIFWTGMEYRFMPPAAAFIAQLRAGRVGRLVMLAMREHRFPFLKKVGDWNRFARNTGGTMVEKCCHFFDLMRLIVGAEAVHVYCSGAMDVNHLDESYGGERPDIIDNSYTVVAFANGVRAMLDLSMFADGSAEQEEFCAVGSDAKLEMFVPSGRLVFSPRVGFRALKRPETEIVGVDEAALAAGSHHGATYYQLQAFLAACRGTGPVCVTAEDGWRAVAIGRAAELSAREGRVVTLAEVGG